MTFTIRLVLLHNRRVIANGSSGTPEKMGRTCGAMIWQLFWKLPNLTYRDLLHVDLPTSEKLANQGRINPRICNDRRYLTENSQRNCKGISYTKRFQ